MELAEPSDKSLVPPPFLPGSRAQIRTPHFAEILDWYHARRGTRAMPGRADFVPEELSRWWRDMVLLSIQPGSDPAIPRYRFEFQGLKPAEYDGGDYTGRHLDEALPARIYGFTAAVYRELAVRRVPLYTLRHVVGKDGFPVVFERLLLPLSSDGTNVDRMIALIRRHSTKDLTTHDLDVAGERFHAEIMVAIEVTD
ncbi:MAG: PAS domain-containing protein [Proteobacteria bacterium]|nr:PAS domain-containing protein [Pseudomonadota bacterium]